MTNPVQWPAGFAPESSPIHAVNAIEAHAEASFVWKRLVEAPLWPDYYPNASDILLPAGETSLRENSIFTWVTAGKKLVTTVREFVPGERIAWEAVLADDPKSTAYHAWVVTPMDAGCHVLTEETQQGPFWEAVSQKRPNGLWQFHQEWIEKLAAIAEADAQRSSHRIP